MITSSMTRRMICIYTIFAITACGNVDELATNILYPFKSVNEKYIVPDAPPEDLNEVWFETDSDDGSTNKIHGWTYNAPNPNANVIVYLHGNGENLQALFSYNMIGALKTLKSHFIIIDYPGLGKSTGTPSEYNLVSAANAAIDWADKKYKDSAVILWGRSLGCAVAAQSARLKQSQLQGLILTSPWNKFIDVAKAKTSLADNITAAWLNRHSYETENAVKEIDLTTLIHHGTKDTLIPVSFGQKVRDNFADPSQVMFVELPELGHNDIFTSPTLWQDVRGFVK